MTKLPSIALLGADEPLGEAILRLLEERGLELGTLFPLSLVESDGCATVDGIEVPLQDAGDFDWGQAQVVVSASRSAAAVRLEQVAVKRGCRVVGFGAQDAVAGKTVLVDAVALALQRVLSAIGRDDELLSVDAVAMLPVSFAGQEGVNELVEQTRGLFAMESPEPGVFPLQVAFNLIPQVGALSESDDSVVERELTGQLRSLLDLPDLPISVTAVWAPVFFGAAVSLHVGLRGESDAAQLRSRLAKRDGITLMDAGLPGGVPTPATDALDSDTVFVGRLRRTAGQPGRIAMWLVVDIARLEAAQIVDWLENLIEK